MTRLANIFKPKNNTWQQVIASIAIFVFIITATYYEELTTGNNIDTQVKYSVISVTDGDTFRVTKDGKTYTIRVLGIDTPETKDPRKPVQCFGNEATAKAKSLLDHSHVQLEPDPTQDDIDRYGRLLRYVYLEDGRLFNLIMIEEGYAFEYTYQTAYQKQQQFKDAQKVAQQHGAGLWADNTCKGKV